MSETADIVSNLPAIILLSAWWAFLSMLELLSRQPGPEDKEKQTTDPPAGKTHGMVDSQGFAGLRKADPNFSVEAFLQGACRAYEEILDAYAQGDLKLLRPLLSADVLQAFTEDCAARTASGAKLELVFVGIRSSEIVNVEAGPEAIEISVLFRAHIIQAEHSPEGEIIRGNPSMVVSIADLWTFSRPPPGSFTWIVVATDEFRETE